MASPATVTIENLSGKFVLNKSLSDDVDPLLQLQGLSWFTRKAISLATVVLTIDEYKKDGVFHIDITSVASGLTSTQEDRTLNWVETDHEDRIFGKVKGRSRLFQINDFEMAGPGGEDNITFLKALKLKDLSTDSHYLGPELLQSWAVSQGGGWTAEQTWGFEEIDKKRYYSRRVIVRKGDQVQRARMVYDYKGEAPTKRDDSDDLAYGD